MTQIEDPSTDMDETDDLTYSTTDRLFNLVGRNSGYVALLAAWIATCGSLFMSEVLGWVPCLLCWYQRILMYPLALVTMVGLLRRDKDMRKYVLVLAIPGACVSLFHYLDQKTDLVRTLVPCTVGVPCSSDYLNAFGGVVTIPFLALIAFLIIIFSMVASRLGSDNEADEVETEKPIQPVQPGRLSVILPVLVIIAAVLLAYGIAATSYRSAAASAAAVDYATRPLPTPDSQSLVRGKVLYEEACAACHGIRGDGTAAGVSLKTSTQLKQGSDADLVKFVRMGRTANDPHNVTGLNMPPSGGRSDASDQDIVAVITYMRLLAKST